MTKRTLSIAMITRNEGENLERSLASVSFADEIIIVDQLSTDNTVEIAKKHGAKVITQEWLGFGKQKNVGIDACTSDWVLSLDADEVVTPKTREAIEQAISQDDFDAFYLPRRVWFFGRWIMHGGWYPDWQLRLFQRGVTKFEPVKVHERVKETDKTGYLPDAVLDHFSYKNINDYIARLNRYTDLEAETRKNESKNKLKLVFKPWYRFVQQYFWHKGFLDGSAGFVVAVLSSFYVLVTHLKIEEQRKGKKK